MKIETSLKAFLKNKFDVLIVTTGHKDFVNEDMIYQQIASLTGELIIIDTVGLLDLEKLPSNYHQNKNFYVLGVGYNES